MPLEPSLEEQTDEELAKRVPTEVRAFEVIMRRYEDPLMRYIFRITNASRESAEDILQESFLKAYQNINSFDISLSFSSWIYRIVYNAVVSDWRKQKVRPEGNAVTIDDTFIDVIIAESDVVGEIDRTYLKSFLEKVLAEIDPKYRDVLVLRYLEEKDYKEIADILKKSMGTVSTLISRAKKALKKELEKERYNNTYTQEL